MKYDLGAMVPKRKAGSTGTFPRIEPAAGTERSMLAALRKLEFEAARLIRELVLPGFDQAKALVHDADESSFAQFKATMNAMVRSTQAQVKTIIDLAGQKHTDQWMVQAKKAFGIDLSGIVKTEDLQGYLDAASLRNASLIQGFSDDMVKTVQMETTSAVIAGKSASELKTTLKAKLGISDNRARLIARDQTSKLNADLTRKRHQDAGIDDYYWRTSHDERVRSLHRHIDGNKYTYGQPTGAESGLPPGQPIQCRCIAEGIVDFGAEETTNPASTPVEQVPEQVVPAPQRSVNLQENDHKKIVGPFWDKLGKIGDQYVQAPDQFYRDPDLEAISKMGQKFNAKTMKFIEGKEGECHWNSAKLFQKGDVDEIVVGYAENEEGWFQHTWSLKDGLVVDTNPSAKKYPATNYYGVPLGKDRSKQFTNEVLKLENAPGNGNVRTIQGGVQWLKTK